MKVGVSLVQESLNGFTCACAVLISAHAHTHAHSHHIHAYTHTHAHNTFVDERDEAELAGFPRRGLYHSCVLDLPKLYMYVCMVQGLRV
jgi:hypothetical protein